MHRHADHAPRSACAWIPPWGSLLGMGSFLRSMELSCSLGIDSRVDAMLVLGQSGLRVGSRDYSLQARDKAEHGTSLKAKATVSIHCTINFGSNFQEDISDKSFYCWVAPEDKPLRGWPLLALKELQFSYSFLFLSLPKLKAWKKARSCRTNEPKAFVIPRLLCLNADTAGA
ncbi:hypothetical protein IscW_ISCW008761 [Ixodes scapularis]|uniref:Uncharacterized protein n=1 Tax=Ixodes scapularis TaxID=6945 RepID=B7PZE8_IXOSC|nr:hypothetical protein IscW_ISCW008761 [Ixodes scapularis]|eukprot:XP_002405206.1 hypothetical protein IscW_ISCW008761 [Ixodes scapularis]